MSSAALSLVHDAGEIWAGLPVDGGCKLALSSAQSTLPKHLQSTLEKWVQSELVSELSGIAPQNVRKALSARSWRGAELMVREEFNGRGRGGKTLKVHVDSLPHDIRARYYLQHGIDIGAKVDAPISKALVVADTNLGGDFATISEEAKAKLNALRPVLATEAGSAERSSAVKALISNGYVDHRGQRCSVGKVSVYYWIKAYEQSGIYGLSHKKRSDFRAKRNIVTREWDGFFSPYMTNEQMTEVGEQVTTYIRSRWASGAPGWAVISEHLTSRLYEISADLNVEAFAALKRGRIGDKPTQVQTQYGLCHVNRRRIECEREYALINVKRRDNALYQDKYAANVKRDYSMLSPRDIVVGDVHPTDIQMYRTDGSKVYPKAISWFDPATNELHMTFVLCEKGEGIRREHVAQSFEAMVDEWGLPRLLYLDNGSEYKWSEMLGGFTLLSKMVGSLAIHDLDTDSRVQDRVMDARENVIRSLAYNARGKPGIEGVFGNLEKVFFSGIRGWTAGDRMNKKTHLKGRDPIAFKGDASEFLAQAATALEYYHKRPQHGRLNGLSPNDALRTAIENGWGKTVVKAGILPLAFASTITRMVTHGAIEYTPKNRRATRYYHDDLLPLTGQRVTVKISPYDPQCAWVFNSNEALICAATPETRYHPLDSAGAVERSRRNKLLSRHISERARHCALLDPVDEMRRHNAHLRDAPEIPVREEIDAPMLSQMLERARIETRAALERPEQAEAAPLSQWSKRLPDSLTNFEWDDDE